MPPPWRSKTNASSPNLRISAYAPLNSVAQGRTLPGFRINSFVSSVRSALARTTSTAATLSSADSFENKVRRGLRDRAHPLCTRRTHHAFDQHPPLLVNDLLPLPARLRLYLSPRRAIDVRMVYNISHGHRLVNKVCRCLTRNTPLPNNLVINMPNSPDQALPFV